MLTKKARKIIVCMLAVVLLAGLCFTVSAGEKTLACSYLKITKDGFVADTFNGVEAKYNLYGPKLYCTELVIRYYKQVYGVDISLGGLPQVLGNDEYWFEEVYTPEEGDVLFGSAAARGKSYNHWAICKSVDEDADTMTLFEQNWRWNGQAGINRVLPETGNGYRYFRLMTADGEAMTEKELAEATITEAETEVLAGAQTRRELVEIRTQLQAASSAACFA